MDNADTEDNNITVALNKPIIVFEGIISQTSVCPNCKTGMRMKVYVSST